MYTTFNNHKKCKYSKTTKNKGTLLVISLYNVKVIKSHISDMQLDRVNILIPKGISGTTRKDQTNAL